MRIGFDVDGVLYDWHSAMQEYHRLYKGVNLSVGDFWNSYWEGLDDKSKCYYASIPTMYSSKLPRPSVLEFLQKVDSLADYLVYITSRPESVKLVTQQYFRKYSFPKGYMLIFTEDKKMHVELLKLDYFVDDSPRHLDKIKNSTTAIQFIRPWNIHYTDSKVPKAHSYDDILRYIKADTTIKELGFGVARGTSRIEAVEDDYDYFKDDLNFDAERERRIFGRRNK